jgi:excisionase family DNA binding protein
VTAARMGPIPKSAVPRLALSKTEAADALGVSVDFLEQHVLHDLKIVRRGRRRLIPLSELQRWIDSNAHRTLGEIRRTPNE